MSLHILQEGHSRITENTSDGDGVLHNMAVWRLANDIRLYIQADSLADIYEALDNCFIPLREEIFEKPEITSSEIYPCNSFYV
ncbi:MAG: hypothetical protein JW723_02730 [Bacteroidales bacterium]|nr:hypothetical protein [Bacteroidales bacterium]